MGPLALASTETRDAALDETLRTIANRLKITRPLAFVDLETTGLDPANDRIVEIAITTVHPDGRVERFDQLLNPERPIPAFATAVHKIGDHDVANAPTFAAIASDLTGHLTGCDIGGFNVAKFDLQLLSAEFTRAGLPIPFGDARIIDAMTIFMKSERRDLEAAVRFYNGKQHNGHRAGQDVAATIDVLAAQLERYADLPKEVAPLADYCNGRRSDWITTDGKIVWKDGAACLAFGKWAGRSLEDLMHKEPHYLHWMLEATFADDLKQI